MDFSNLKKQRGSALTALTDKLSSMNKGASNTEKDARIYKPGFDKKEGKGYAVVRFLPPKAGEPFVRIFGHAFNYKGNWYIEQSRVTIGESDPVAISNALYWKKGEAEGNEALKNIARARKRTTKYFANVLVIKDTVNPENNGKVMIYEFGAQVFKILEKAAKPEFEDDEPLDAFDMWTGADFKIKMVGKEIPDSRSGKKTIVPTYEDSEFAKSSELFEGDDEKKEEVFNQTTDLSEFIKVKTFDELAARFKKVTGEAHDALENGDPAESIIETMTKKAEQSESQDNDVKVGKSASKEKEPEPEPDDDDDDVLAMFKKLAEED